MFLDNLYVKVRIRKKDNLFLIVNRKIFYKLACNGLYMEISEVLLGLLKFISYLAIYTSRCETLVTNQCILLMDFREPVISHRSKYRANKVRQFFQVFK